MANRFPLIVDTDDNNKIKELPIGDSLDLTSSNIVNAGSIQANGTLTVQNLVLGGTPLADVALSGDFTDLINVPSSFSGNYNDLTNKPTIPQTTRQLADVQDVEPDNGDVLQYNNITGRYEPTNVQTNISLSAYTLGDIGNVLLDANTTNQYLKYYSGAWRGTTINYNDVTNKPVNLSQFINDVGFITSETDSQTLTLVGSNLTISNGNTVDLSALGYLTQYDETSTLNDVLSRNNNAELQTMIVNHVTGDLTGSVFADDSTLLVDAVNGTIPGYVNLAELKSIAASSADFSEFKTAIANL